MNNNKSLSTKQSEDMLKALVDLYHNNNDKQTEEISDANANYTPVDKKSKNKELLTEITANLLADI